MNKKDFKDLTSEDPEDILGGDWENDLEELESLEADHVNNCSGCAKCEL